MNVTLVQNGLTLASFRGSVVSDRMHGPRLRLTPRRSRPYGPAGPRRPVRAAVLAAAAVLGVIALAATSDDFEGGPVGDRPAVATELDVRGVPTRSQP